MPAPSVLVFARISPSIRGCSFPLLSLLTSGPWGACRRDPARALLVGILRPAGGDSPRISGDESRSGRRAIQAGRARRTDQSSAQVDSRSPKNPASNCCQRVANRPLRPSTGRFETHLQQLEYRSIERTAVLFTQSRTARRTRLMEKESRLRSGD